jgi:hypothetical protein
MFREQLITCILALHAAQIHHHDIAARNVLVDSKGKVTLIDLNVAEEITGKCICCPDEEALEELGEFGHWEDSDDPEDSEDPEDPEDPEDFDDSR